jgi:predicted DNA binding protein
VNKIIKILEKQQGRLEISTEDVYKNAGLNNKDRIAAAIDLLDTNNLSPAQKDALMKAHEIG